MSTVEGEVGITASMSGRSQDRESVTTRFSDELVRFYRATSTLFCGFQQEWLDGEDAESGARFDLTAGAGVGSRYMVLTVELQDGTTVHEYVDVTELLGNRVMQIVEEHYRHE